MNEHTRLANNVGGRYQHLGSGPMYSVVGAGMTTPTDEHRRKARQIVDAFDSQVVYRPLEDHIAQALAEEAQRVRDEEYASRPEFPVKEIKAPLRARIAELEGQYETMCENQDFLRARIAELETELLKSELALQANGL